MRYIYDLLTLLTLLYLLYFYFTYFTYFLLWRNDGKPRSGFYFENMKTSRAQFKLALRYCKTNVEEMKANACAESLFDTDPQKNLE